MKNHLPPAMILAAGKGERLRPLTHEVPKPALPIGGKPLILRTLYWLKQQGIREVIVNLYYKRDFLLELLNSSPLPFAISIEEELLGTGGGIRRATSLWDGEWLLVINGDTLLDLDLLSLISFLDPQRMRALLVLRKDPEPRRWGAIYLPPSPFIARPILSFFSATTEEAQPYMFTGIHFIHRSFIHNLPRKGCVVRDAYARFTQEGIIWGYIYDGPWLEIGSIESYHLTQEVFLSGGVPWLLLPEEKV